MEISFLDALRRGDLQQVSELISKTRKILFDRDPEGRNCLGVAVAQGKWALALTLLREYRVSPHAIDNNGEGLFHLIARGLAQNPATIEDYAEIRNELLTFWDKEERIEEAMWRSIRWLDRCISAHNRKTEQNLFPIDF